MFVKLKVIARGALSNEEGFIFFVSEFSVVG